MILLCCLWLSDQVCVIRNKLILIIFDHPSEAVLLVLTGT